MLIKEIEAIPHQATRQPIYNKRTSSQDQDDPPQIDLHPTLMTNSRTLTTPIILATKPQPQPKPVSRSAPASRQPLYAEAPGLSLPWLTDSSTLVYPIPPALLTYKLKQGR
jgi:hypothetical protein